MTRSQVQAVTQCLGISSTQVDQSPAEAADPEYDDPDSSSTVAETVDVFPSASAAQFDVSAAANPKLPTCFVQLAPRFESTAPRGMTFGTLSASRADVPSLGDKDAALAASVPFTYQGVSGTLSMETVVVVRDRSESNLLFTATTTPDSTQVSELSTAAAAALRPG